ncbi:hypothetical protein BJX68DRAFT_261759 [Aspergillus pseudodeflectus]|uniref:Uncharacterized protein n=1 Tax=Aspergillus pseudodeflectus TaxID=176178 RepID=A0ABR4L4B0_9EURO
MVDIGGIIGYTTTTGIEALKILNKWLDSKETAKAWYGKDANDFLKTRFFGIKLFRNKFTSPEIKNVFTIQKEDWQLVMEESLPAAHTWYRKRKDKSGECSWLPLYWSCRDQLSKERVLQSTDLALASIGLVSGLPAARLDLWGLIVMAYSNGARARVMTVEGRGFNATLLCKNFILTISQSNVNAPTIGHLEPREHPAVSHESMTVDESRYLLEYGHTFSPQGVTTAWVLNGQNSDPPPSELVDSRSDPLLSRTVLDTFQASALKKKFHHGIIEYWEEWAKFMAPRQCNGDQDNLLAQTEPTPRCARCGHVKLDTNVVREMEALHELKTEIGMLSYGSEQSDDKRQLSLSHQVSDITQPSNNNQPANNNQPVNNNQPPNELQPANDPQPANNHQSSVNHQPSNDRPLPGDMLNKLKRIHILVVKMLWRLKLLFLYESIELVDNLNPHEVLYVFRAYGELIRTLTHSHILHRYMDLTRPGLNAKQDLGKLLNYHYAILARSRMLNFCQEIHSTLSVRNTPHDVLLS